MAKKKAADKPVPEFESDDIVTMMSDADRRLVELRTYRSAYVSTWRDLSAFLFPTRGRFDEPAIPNNGSRGLQQNRQIVDRTATKAIKRLASFLQTGICSPARKWFQLDVQDQKVAQDPAVRAWLDDTTDRILTVFAESNFYQSMSGLFEELPVFGTGCLVVLRDYHDVIRTYLLTAGEYLLACDDRLQVDTLYREYVMTVAQMAQRFGRDNMSDSAQGLLDSMQLGREICIVNVIAANSAHEPGRLGWRGQPYVSIHYEWGSGRARALRIEGMPEFQVIAPRWDTVSNDVYGKGPGEDALPDVRALQMMQRRAAEAVDRMVKPPLMADPSLSQSTIDLLPGAVNFVNLQSGGMKPIFEVPPNIQGLSEKIQEIRQQIQETFYSDLIAMFSSGDGPEMTAEEVRAKKEEKMLLLGPMLERFHDEALSRVIDITFNIMLRGGLLLPAPKAVQGRHVTTTYLSVLAQAQRAVGTTAIEGTVKFVGDLAGLDPNALDNVDMDEAIREYADLLGAPPKMVRSAADVAHIRDAKTRAAQQQAAQQQSMAAVQGAQTLSQTDVGGGQNALQKMLGG